MQKSRKAGKTIGAEFDVEKNKAVWEIKVLGSAGVKEYKIDASSGAVVKVEDKHIRGKLTNFLTGMNLKDLEAAKTPLTQAVATAEKKANGKSVKVQVEHERGGIQLRHLRSYRRQVRKDQNRRRYGTTQVSFRRTPVALA